MPPGDVARVVSAAVFGFFLLVWVGSTIGGLFAVVTGEASLWLLLFLILWVAAGFFMGRIAWLIIQPTRPETITLYADRLKFDPGTSPIVTTHTYGNEFNPQAMRAYAGNGNYFYRELFSKREPVKMLRSDIAEITIEPGRYRKRLFLIVGSKRTEIGEGMWDSDREWLYRVLVDWKKDEAK
jgi:hypothetical protein